MQSNLNDEAYHTPVLLHEVLAAIKPHEGSKIIDATLGGGGHTRALAEKGASILAIDFDQDAIVEAKKWLNDFSTVKVVEGSFEDLLAVAQKNDFMQANGILFDLGVSSYQLNEPRRGFSFRFDGPLDMRMNKKFGLTAADLVNTLSEKQLVGLLKEFGEEPRAKHIAQAISRARSRQKITTTAQLAHIIADAVGERSGKINAATKTFQALRIAVNFELDALRNALPQALEILHAKGIMAVISFHSLEDRVVKQQFITWQEKQQGTVLTKKPIVATEAEVMQNPRSRSAKLRVFEKV